MAATSESVGAGRAARAIRARASALRPSDLATASVLVWLGGVAAFLAAVAVLVAGGFELDLMTGDATALAGAPAETGSINRLGVLLWGAGAGMALVTVLVARGTPQWRAYLLTLGAGLAFLGCDDAFMLHEVVLPKAIDLPELVFLGAWVLIAGVWLARYASRVHREARPLFGLALASFAVSLVVDELHVSEAVEDVFKVMGIGAILGVVVVEALVARRGSAA